MGDDRGEKRVYQIEGVNPFSIEPACCAAWLANLETLIARGVENESGEILHEIVAVHPGTRRSQEVSLYLKS